MKIKTQKKSYEEVIAIPQKEHKKPIKPNMVFRTLTKALSVYASKKSELTCNKIGMERLGKDEKGRHTLVCTPASFRIRIASRTVLKLLSR